MTTSVDFRSPRGNRRASSLLGATASPGIRAVYSEHYSAKKNPLNPQRTVKTSTRRTLAKSLAVASARSPSKLPDEEINAAPADDLAERPLKESISDDGKESISEDGHEDEHDDHDSGDRHDDRDNRDRRRSDIPLPRPFKGKGRDDPSLECAALLTQK